MDSSRTPKQERSQRRRDALLKAAVELAAEGGPQAITHRAVAARAGLPSSTAGYFFASIDDLAAEALRVYTQANVDRIRSMARVLTAPGSMGVDQLIQAVASNSPDPQLQLAQVATYLEASRNPALRAPVADSLEANIDVGREVLASMGVPRASAAAPMAAALLDGFMLHSLAKPDDPPSPKVIADALDALLCGFLLTADERRKVKQRLQSTVKTAKAVKADRRPVGSRF